MVVMVLGIVAIVISIYCMKLQKEIKAYKQMISIMTLQLKLKEFRDDKL